MKGLFTMLLPFLGKGKILKYIVLGILSGLCSFLFINAVTRVISLMMAGTFTSISEEYIILFAFIILLFISVRRTLALTIINLSQIVFWRLRMKILSLTLNADYRQLTARRSQIHAAIVSDVGVLTNASLSIIDFFTSLVLAVSCIIYLASISFVLFAITLIVVLIGVTVYHLSSKANVKAFQRSRNLENKFQENFSSILDGFKEIYMDPKKGRFIYQKRIIAIANESYKNNTSAFTGFLNNQITGQILFYLLISSVLLFLGFKLSIKHSDTVSFIFTLLYLLGSVETIMVLLPAMMRAGVASNHLMKLKSELEGENFTPPVSGKYHFKDEFSQISISDLEFHYGEPGKSFGVGPINFEVRKGEIIFIYGGNGSGKTTFIHSVLGLCLPSSGEIRINGVLVDTNNYTDYRSAFSVVFSNFYLFNEIIGVDNLDMEKWNYYICLFELENVVKIEGNGFSTTDLSMGQRKRLALIAALLERKPILVLDEWAADQDPYFRKKFYTEILALLKKDNITVIAITHDDKYYHCADKLYKMDYGKLIEKRVDIGESAVVI